MTITSKSEYVLEIKFGKISSDSSRVTCDSSSSRSPQPTTSYDDDSDDNNNNNNNENEHEEDGYISREYVYVDTNYGVKCPLQSGIYEKLNSKQQNSFQSHTPKHDHQSSSEYALPVVIAPPPQPSITTTTTTNSANNNEPCKYLTQTQTLQVGCHNEQQYSLRTRLCYPNQNSATITTRTTSTTTNDNDESSTPPRHRHSSSSTATATAYTQLESEINLVCLADWTHKGKHVIVSRTMSNEILCSVSSQ